MTEPDPNVAGNPGEPAQAGAQAKPKKPRKRKILRVVLWTLAILFGLLLLLFGLLLLALANLEHPMLKGWVTDAVADAAGISIDYDELSVAPFSGLDGRGFVIHTPAPYADHAPELLRVDDIDVAWGFWSLLGDKPNLSAVELSGIKLTVVIDEAGRTSFDVLGPTSTDEPKPEPPEPDEPVEPDRLSELLRDVLPSIAVDSLAVRDIVVEVLWLERGAIIRRAVLDALCVTSGLDAQAGALSAKFRLQPCDADTGVKLAVEEFPGTPRAQQREFVAALRIALDTPSATRIDLAVDAEFVRQSLVDDIALPAQLMRLRAGVEFSPQQAMTTLRIDDLIVLDGVLSSTLLAEIADRPDGSLTPLVKRAHGGLDLDLLNARLGPVLATELSDYQLRTGRLGYEITDLVIDADTGVIKRGDVKLDGALPRAQIIDAGDVIALDRVVFDLDAKLRESRDSSQFTSSVNIGQFTMTYPSGERIAFTALTGTITGERVELNSSDPLVSRGAFRIASTFERVDTDLDGQQTELHKLGFDAELSGGPMFAGTISTPIETLVFREPSVKLGADISGIEFDWALDEFDPNFDRPAKGVATLHMASGTIRDGSDVIKLSRPSAVFNGLVIDPYHYDGEFEMPVPGMTVTSSDDLSVRVRGARYNGKLTDFVLNDDAPERSRGGFALTSRFARLTIAMPDFEASGRSVGFSITTTLDGSDRITATGALPIGQLRVRDPSSGDRLARVDNGRLNWRTNRFVLADDPLQSRGKVRVTGSLPSFALPDSDVSVELPSLMAELSLGRKTYDAKVRADLTSYESGGARRKADMVTTLSAKADLRKPTIDATLTIRGPDGPELSADIDAGFARGARKLTYTASIVADRLGLIGELLPRSIREQHKLDWRALRIDGETSGELSGVIERFGAELDPVFVAEPLVTADGKQTLTLTVRGLDYESPDQAIATPELVVTFDASQQTGPITANLDIRSDRIAVTDDKDEYTIVGLNEHLELSSSSTPDKGRLDLTMTTDIGQLDQELIDYPVKNARLVLRGYFDRLSSLRVDKLVLTNPAGGTKLDAKLAMDRLPSGRLSSASVIPGRQAMALTGTLYQDLAPVAISEDAPRMRGKVELPFRLESGDLSAFLIVARAKLDNVHADLPDDEISIAGFDGDIPVVADIAIMPDGSIAVLDGPSRNLYSRTRFLDVHPFLRGEHFLAIKSVTVGGEKLGPIAGNLRLERDMFALDQLQLGYRRGTISGQIVADYHGGSPRILFRGNATGIRPSNSDDILDANAAVTFIPSKLDLAGRLQIVRLGRDHLRAMLDVLDPYREDGDFNKLRLALNVGYPKFVRLRMKDGFLAAKIKLGGASKIVQIDEIRGIALEPLLNYYLVPYLPEGVVK